MAHFFERRDRWGNSLGLYVLLLVLFSIPPSVWALGKLSLKNDVEGWLPQNDPELLVLHWTKDRFPMGERVFVSWDSSSLGDPRVPALAEKINGLTDDQGIKRLGLKQIEKVTGPAEALQTMLANGVEYPEAIRRLEGTILGAGALKVRLTPTARPRSARVSAEIAKQALAKFGLAIDVLPAIENGSRILLPVASSSMTPGLEGEGQREVEIPETPAVLSADGKLLPEAKPDHDFQLSWRGMRMGTVGTVEFANWLLTLQDGSKGEDRGAKFNLIESSFFVPGAPVALALTLSDTGLADKKHTLERLQVVAAEVGIPAAELRMGGSAVAGSELNQQVKRSLWNKDVPLTWLHKKSVLLSSLIVGSVLTYLLVRSFRLTAIVMFAAIYTILAMVALVPITGGSMNMVLVVMPTLLLVLTLSGAIHLVNYWKHASVRNPATAIAESVASATTPCILASVTTAIGLASLCTSSLEPVFDFGVYGAIGTLFSLVAVLLIVPALLQLWPGEPPKPQELEHRGWRTLGTWLIRRPILGASMTLAVSAAATLGLLEFKTETKVVRYFPESSRVIQDYWFLENHLTGVAGIEVVVRFDQATQDRTNLLDRAAIVRQLEEKIRLHEEITGAISLADFIPEVERPATGSSTLANIRYNKRANLMQDRIRNGEVAAAKAFYCAVAEAHDLTTPGDAGLNKAGDEIWRITAQVGVMPENSFAQIFDDLDLLARDVLRQDPGANHVITGTVPLFLRTQQAVLDSLIQSSGLAFVLILGVMVWLMRSFWAGLVSMIPNVLPITVVFGAISWAGQKIDIGSMITSSIALGIAVDGTLHFLAKFRLLTMGGMKRQDAIVESLVHCGPAIWHTSLAVSLGLLMLMPADLLLISRFGWLMAALVGVALLGDVILLPQLLATPFGRLFLPQHPATATTSVSLPETVPATSDTTGSLVPGPHIALCSLPSSLPADPRVAPAGS